MTETDWVGTDWANRRVLVTGHTGFKGAWLCEWLLAMGAQVSGLALAPGTTPALFTQLGLAKRIQHHVIADITDASALAGVLKAADPEVVFHLAAQSLVRVSYRDPVETWRTNVMGTAAVLEALRLRDRPAATVIVTTDKVYENREWVHGYRETDRLGGHDPYSASKAGTELVAASYRTSFLDAGPVRMATARAGNVIGGGDWAEDRLVPDIFRAITAGQPVEIRNPGSVRPWQHVLDPLAGYLKLAEALLSDAARAHETGYNFGPDARDNRTVGEVVAAVLNHMPGAEWRDASDRPKPSEAGLLRLSIDKARSALGWSPRWGFETAIARTAQWYGGVAQGEDPGDLTRAQIADFQTGATP